VKNLKLQLVVLPKEEVPVVTQTEPEPLTPEPEPPKPKVNRNMQLTSGSIVTLETKGGFLCKCD